ncbi:hypothetical protein [Candidatus Anaplasma sp. TIGMIC]|nr:hypothetical protein [Candidatus Anaplasma sp. TIGMIC]MDB1135400.1 hypothetical protein [Candidatus Anaplasma sp. TIGMIC]
MGGARSQNSRNFVVNSGIRPQVVPHFSRFEIALLRSAVLRYARDARHSEEYRSWVLDIVLLGSESALIRAARHFMEEEMQFMAQNNPPPPGWAPVFAVHEGPPLRLVQNPNVAAAFAAPGRNV